MTKFTAFLFLMFPLVSFALFDPEMSKGGKCLITGMTKNEFCVGEGVAFEETDKEGTKTGTGKIKKIKIDSKDKRPKAMVHVEEGTSDYAPTKSKLNLKGRVLWIDSSDLYKAERVK
jgi:hypothetical protein